MILTWNTILTWKEKYDNVSKIGQWHYVSELHFHHCFSNLQPICSNLEVHLQMHAPYFLFCISNYLLSRKSWKQTWKVSNTVLMLFFWEKVVKKTILTSSGVINWQSYLSHSIQIFFIRYCIKDMCPWI